MIATNGGRYCLVDAEEIDVGVDGRATVLTTDFVNSND